MLTVSLTLVAILNALQFCERWQFSRVLRAVRSLEQEHAPLDEVQRRLAALGVDQKPECRDDRCMYQIFLGPIYQNIHGRGQRALFQLETIPTARAILEAVGIRPVGMRVTITARSGRTEDFSVALFAGYGPALAAVYQKSNVIRAGDPSLHLHPDFLVRRFVVNKPYAATVIEVDITPDATPEEAEIAWDFNLGCITRWGGCQSVDEMKHGSATRGNPVSHP